MIPFGIKEVVHQATMQLSATPIDVAIVGGGCAGLYCAWRLATQSNKPSTYVFERSERIGGRLLSIDLLPSDGLKAELGGMRFTEDHLLVKHLISQLRGVSPEISPLDTRDFNFETKLMYLRARHLRFDQTWREKLRYDLPDLDPFHSSSKDDLASIALTMAKTAIQKSLAQASIDLHLSKHLGTLRDKLTKKCLTVAEWRELQKYARVDGIHLYDLGFWNLLQHCLREATDEFHFLHDALGYESLVANSNAAQTIPVFLADFGVEGYKTLKGGMEALPRFLAFRCREANGKSVIANHHTVESITLVQEDGEQFFDLEVKCTPLFPDANISYPACYRAKNVILALPKEALKGIKLVGFSSEEATTFRNELDEVTAHPAFKMFLRYEGPWWKQELGLKARAITDLPIRQVYYLGEEAHPEGPALVMASYSDEHYVDFWDPLVYDPNRIREARAMKEQAMSQRRDISAFAASRRMIDKAESQLRLMHPDISIPHSQYGVVQKWPEAWHFWNVHSKPWDTAERLVRPFSSTNLFVCGEAYSLEQGWVEGALKSAERVMQAMDVVSHAPISNLAEYITH